MTPRVVNDLVPPKERMAAFAINPLISHFSPSDTLETCAGLIGELGQLISLAHDKDPQAPMANMFHLFGCIEAAMLFELRAGKPA